MVSKAIVVLVVCSLIELGASADKSCEEEPNLTCLVKAFIKPYHSLKCTVEAAQAIRDASEDFENAVLMCSEDNRNSEKAKQFYTIIENIKTNSEKINTACKSDADDELKPGVICGAKAMTAFLKLRESNKNAGIVRNEAEALGKSCFFDFAKSYLNTFPLHQRRLNKCIFEKPETTQN